MENDPFCEGIDMVFTGMQGPQSRYQPEMEPDGLHVTDMATGQTQIASPVTKRKNSKEDRWYIQTENGKKYFGQNQIRASKLRMKMHERPIEETRKRYNVEATIFHLIIIVVFKGIRWNSLYNDPFLWQNFAMLVSFWIYASQQKNQIQRHLQTTNIGRLQRPVDKPCKNHQIYTTNMSRNASNFKNQVNYHFFRLFSSAMNVLKEKIDLNVIKYVFLLVFLKLINF